MTAPGFWKYAGATTPPPPPPSAHPSVVFNFDFEAVDVESYEAVSPNAQYSTTSFDGYYVTWTGNVKAQNAENTGLTPEEQPGYRAVLGRDPSIIDGTTKPVARFDVTVPFNRNYYKLSFNRLGAVKGGIRATDGTWINTFDIPLSFDPIWHSFNTGWNAVSAGKLFWYFTVEHSSTTSFGLWFIDNLRIEFADTLPTP
jgi:hypothetical protein